MTRIVVVGGVMIFASQGHSSLERCHSGHLRIVLFMESFLATHVLPFEKHHSNRLVASELRA